MADEADLAQYYSDLLINEGLTRVRRQLEGTGLTTCKECGDPIPPQRRESIPGVRTCVTCQEILEHQRKVGVSQYIEA
ncbi:TraR/DksA family transcriptional regulator [Yersinia enterocolitica]|uniref:TraR/DksA family transcriptional regulator n=1 Tax=Yersinia enterocolitica TaxID=630 RepID=UPI003AB58DB5